MKPPLCMILHLLLQVRFLTVVTATDCRSALGVESGAIRNSQFSASSSWSSDWQPWGARLYSRRAWYPRLYSTSEWLQVDLLKMMSITGIQTQGHEYRFFSYYVTSYKLLYSDNGTDFSWNTFQENGSDKIFEGNSDADSVKTNTIDPPIVTRFIRLMAVTWELGIAFRLELLGCELQVTTSAAPPTTVTLPTAEGNTTVNISKKATAMQTTPSPSVTTYSVSSTKEITVTAEGITQAVQQRSTSFISRPEVTSPSSTNTSGNSDRLAGNPAGTNLGAIIGGAVAAGVVIVIIAIMFSIFCIRRRRSKDTDGNQSSPQPDETERTDRIYNNAVMFTANGNASNNGNVTIGRMKGATSSNVAIDQSQETISMENVLYAHAGATSGATGQSQDMVDNNLYASIRKEWMEKTHQQQLGISGGVYENIPPATSSGEYQELRPAVYQSLKKY